MSVLRPIYTTLDFWYGSDKNGTRTKFIRARTTYLQGPSTDKFGTRTNSIRAVPKIERSVNGPLLECLIPLHAYIHGIFTVPWNKL